MLTMICETMFLDTILMLKVMWIRLWHYGVVRNVTELVLSLSCQQAIKNIRNLAVNKIFVYIADKNVIGFAVTVIVF